MKANFFITSPFIKTLVYANVFIAICSAAQVVVTDVVFSIPFDLKNNSFILFVCLSTFLQYNMQRGYLLNTQNASTESSQWIQRHKKILLYCVGASLITVLFLCNNLSYWSIGIMVGAEVISTMYYLPPLNIRKYGYFKPLIISAIWVISCVAVPLIENNLITLNSSWFLASQFCFISALCMVFDIKDMTEDYLKCINTYANSLGVFKTKLISILLLLLSVFCFYQFEPIMLVFIAQLLVIALTATCIVLTNEVRHRFYYHLALDGMLLLQAIAIFGVGGY